MTLRVFCFDRPFEMSYAIDKTGAYSENSKKRIYENPITACISINMNYDCALKQLNEYHDLISFLGITNRVVSMIY